MLWRAGQERVTREERTRMGEMFLAVHDALRRAVVPVLQVAMDKVPNLPLPAYLDAPAPLRTLESRERALAKLAAMFPGMVQRGAPLP